MRGLGEVKKEDWDSVDKSGWYIERSGFWAGFFYGIFITSDPPATL